MADTKLSRASRQRVSDPAAAKFLSNAVTAAYLRPFLKEATSISAAAERIGTTVQRMHYWVGRFCKLGLLHVTHSETRPGRAVRYYRASAESFFVPFTATPAETQEALLLENDARLHQLFNEGLVRAFSTSVDNASAWGVWIRGEGQGLEWGHENTAESCSLLELMREAHAPAIVSSTQQLALTREEALELQRELLSLWQRFESKRPNTLTDKGRAPYLLRLGLAPLIAV